MSLNKSQLKGRQTKFMNHLSQDEDKLEPSYERQVFLRKNGRYEDTRKRVA